MKGFFLPLDKAQYEPGIPCKLTQMQMTLDTIIIFVQNIENLRSFYIEGLGMEIIEDQQPEWLLLGAGACKVGLHKIGDAYLDSTKEPITFDNNVKISFEIFEDIHTVRSQFIDMGILMKEVKTFDNYDYWLCDGEDPEGNVFQLKERKAAASKN